MSENHIIIVQSINGTLDTLTVEVASAPPWKLTVSGLGFHSCVFEGSDLFEALLALRRELEKTGYYLLCGGARVDVFPSGMSRSMGGARKMYIMRLGEPATAIIDIFDGAGSELVGTIDQQKEFHNKWIHSLMNKQ